MARRALAAHEAGHTAQVRKLQTTARRRPTVRIIGGAGHRAAVNHHWSMDSPDSEIRGQSWALPLDLIMLPVLQSCRAAAIVTVNLVPPWTFTCESCGAWGLASVSVINNVLGAPGHFMASPDNYDSACSQLRPLRSMLMPCSHPRISGNWTAPNRQVNIPN
jgi:hypothetical protein